ncbi:ABC-2 transporter permease [Sporosarcina sp. ACRSL]|uniref:ABC-2 transporter permease n=1 Tax=Sporosarcina sp. ACRSL TaxID=2918215 RepID=UPI001EF658B2|nr:ABC-2 transporter permease [Sporosarcina sp. ACRSL]MCG7345998.1 ABC-2 transporter permease [Sporosarcina sp. ACRSL]
MLNLIRKDIVLQKNSLLILLPALFIFLFLERSVIWVGVIFCFAIIMQSFALDEKPSANLLMNSLPYTRKEIVSSKYIGACVFTFLVLLTIVIGNLIIHREITQWDQLLFIASVIVVFISFAFPFSYLFKSQYLMMACGVLFVLYVVLVNTFIPDLGDRLRAGVQTILSFDNSLLYAGGILAAVLLYMFSWMLSIRIYSRKVF